MAANLATPTRLTSEMAFSKGQAATAWTCMGFMGGMLLYPPWFWEGEPNVVWSSQFAAGYDWLWSPPPTSPEESWRPTIMWSWLLLQWITVAIGMLLLLYLREARERNAEPATVRCQASDRTVSDTVRSHERLESLEVTAGHSHNAAGTGVPAFSLPAC